MYIIDCFFQMILQRLSPLIYNSLQIRTYSVTKVIIFIILELLLLCDKEKIGFIGVGNMGSHMASNLMKSGHSLIIHDKDSSLVDKMVTMGARKAPNPAAVAMETSTIITMLPSR